MNVTDPEACLFDKQVGEKVGTKNKHYLHKNVANVIKSFPIATFPLRFSCPFPSLPFESTDFPGKKNAKYQAYPKGWNDHVYLQSSFRLISQVVLVQSKVKGIRF